MASEWDTPPPKRRRPWLKRLAWISGIGGIVLLTLYFFITSSFFLRHVILPKISDALHAEVTADSVSLSRLSRLRVRRMKVHTVAGAEPLVTVEEINARVALMKVIGGNLVLHEVAIASPTIQIVENADGTTNLDPLLKSSTEPAPAAASKPLRFELGRFEVANACVRRIKLHKDGSREVAEVCNARFTASDLGNGKLGGISFAADLRQNRLPPGEGAATTNNLLQASLHGEFAVGLTDELKPRTLRGETTLEIARAPESLSQLSGLRTVLACELTPFELENLSLTFVKSGTALGQISAKGPLDLAQQEGRVRLEIGPLDRKLFNLLGASRATDFGTTTFKATNEFTLSEHGKHIAAAGKLSLAQFSLARKAVVSPSVDLELDYQVLLNLADQSAEVKALALSGTQNRQPLVRGGLTRPMKLVFGASGGTEAASTFTLALTNLNLADWRGLLGDVTGQAGLTCNLRALQSGRMMEATLAGRLAGFTGEFGGNRTGRADFDLGARGQLEQFSRLRLEEFHLRLDHDKQPALTVAVNGQCDFKTPQADFQVQFDALPARLAKFAVIPGLDLSSGTLKVAARVLQQNTTAADPGQTWSEAAPAFTGRMQLQDLTGRFAGAPLDRLGAEADWTLAMTNRGVALRKFTLSFAQAGQAAGSLEMAGRHAFAPNSGDVTIKLIGVNQRLLQPLVGAALGGKTLASVSIDATTTARYDPKGESAVDATMRIANLLVTDPAHPRNAAGPAQLDWKLEGRLQNDLVELRQLRCQTLVGKSSGGSLTLSGQHDLKKQTTQVALNVADLNQHLLAPFAGAALGRKTLASVSINADVIAGYDPRRPAPLQGKFSMTNLLVIGPEGKPLTAPLAAGLSLDGSFGQKLLAWQKLQLQLSRTERADNRLTITGRVDLSRSNAISGDLLVAGDALDLTQFQNLFADSAPATVPPSPARPDEVKPAAAGKPAATEPPVVALPFGRFNCSLKLGKLYFGEVAAENWLVDAAIDGNRIRINPFALVLNRAPIKADAGIDLGVPGYRYDISVAADRLALEPILNTFLPEKRGQIRGDFSLATRLRGSGITGANLCEHLSGQANVSLTNAALNITRPALKAFLTPVALVLRTPGLFDSPLTYLGIEGRVDGGRLQIAQFNAASDSYTAYTQGDIKLVPELTKSPIQKWPVQLALRRRLAETIRMAPRNTPPDAAYVKMPVFFKVAGTLGEPKAELNPGTLAGTALEKLGDKFLPKAITPGLSNP